MMILGLVLVALGAAGLLISFFGASIDNQHRSAEILNWDVNAGTLVLWGAVSTLLICLGLWVMKSGARRGRERRKENKRLQELSEKLDRAEAERHDDDLSGREDR